MVQRKKKVRRKHERKKEMGGREGESNKNYPQTNGFAFIYLTSTLRSRNCITQ